MDQLKLIRKIGTICFALVLNFYSYSVLGSHVSGIDISYTCLGNNQYEITMNLYRDCSGITMATSEDVDFVSNCGGTATLTLNLIPPPPGGIEISQLCQTQLPQSTCNGGTLPGMEVYTYTGTVTLNPPCDSWIVSWSTCCRNETINVPTSDLDDIYGEAVMNTATNNCNNSPIFQAQPIPYVCNNQPVFYNFDVYDPDGDSLAYKFIAGREDPALALVYAGGYSAIPPPGPIPGITLDPITGEINFTPNGLGNYIVVVEVEEWDANGNLLGTVMRDIQFTVISCTNFTPDQPTGMDNFTGTAIQSGPFSIEVCTGNDFCMDLAFSDPDPNDTLTLSSNVTTVLPGATFTTTGVNPAIATICWTAIPGSPAINIFSVTAEDDACPVTSMTQQTIDVTFIEATTVSPDPIICGNQSTQLVASGGSIFDWYVVSGDPIVVGSNFSCNPCFNPIAQPAYTTTYEVVSNLTSTCVNRDTVTVNVVPDFTTAVTQSSQSSCLLEDVQFTVDVIPNLPGYSFSWTPATNLDDPNIPDPTLTPNVPGTFVYYCEITSPDGCVKVDSATVNIAAAYVPNITATISDSAIICGDTIYLDVEFGGTVPQNCGISITGCGGAIGQVDIGSQQSSNSSSSYPAPYGNTYWGARHQFMIQATELQAMGFNGGQITELALNVADLNGNSGTFNDFRIKMGCSANNFLGTWVPGLSTVFPAQTINVSSGWNTHVFGNVFDWDGVSNLVVEICFSNGSSSNNISTYYTPTPFSSVIYSHADNTAVCGSPVVTGGGQNRPDFLFTVCDPNPPASTFDIEWTPSTGLSDPLIKDPWGLPYTTTDYQVVVTHNLGGCSDSSTVHIDVNCGSCFPPIPTITDATCNGLADGAISVIPIGMNGPPWTYNWFDANNTLIQTSTVAYGDEMTGLAAGQYTIQLMDTTGCYDDTIVFVNEPTVVQVMTNDTIVCSGTDATISASAIGGNGGYSYNWGQGLVGDGPHIVSPATPTFYTVFSVDSLGCTSPEDTVNVDLHPPLSVSTSGNDTICEGAAANISAIGSGGIGSPYNYSWFDGNGSSVGLGSAIQVTPSNTPTLYIVEVDDGCGSPTAKDSLFIEWHLAPNPTFTVDTNQNCVPAVITFTNTTDPNTVGTNCLWDFGDGNTANACNTIVNSYQQTGCFDVSLTVYSPQGCPGDTMLPQFICSNPYPSPEFIMSPNPAPLFDPLVGFLDQSTGAIDYLWHFGENGILGTSTESSPSFVFPNNTPSTYPVTQYVTNEFGCTNSITYYLVTEGDLVLYIPNAFSPDDDGLNESFKIEGDGISSEGFEMTVFDRWGQIVFSTTDLMESWDGTFQNGGTDVTTGIYAWRVMLASEHSTERKEYLGHVTLIR